MLEKRKVPGSYRPVGDSIYKTDFSCLKDEGHRILLCFEGICYEGIAVINGHELSEMEPYSYYSYDITEYIRNGENTLEVKLKDINAVFGPMNGWCNYSGIVRDVYLQIVPQVFMENIFFHYTLDEGYKAAFCQVECALNRMSGQSFPARVLVQLKYNQMTVAEQTVIVSGDRETIAFTVHEPVLWSTETPLLYELYVSCGEHKSVQVVGFKDFTIVGKRFYLNGKPIFLMGACRHDIQEDVDGHTQTDRQIEKDMHMMKNAGFNYVRLVHYPHDRRVVEYADKLGLLVSCEPGFWWSKLDNVNLVARGLEVMKKVVMRDRSHVSVAFWLTFNECELTEDFICTFVDEIRKIDSTHFVSGANCMDKFQTKTLFDKANCDFYTYHPYGTDYDLVTGGVSPGRQYVVPFQSLQGICEYLGDKPVLFTEWGGTYTLDNPALLRRFLKEIFRLGDNPDNVAALAGACYWVWSDYYERNRRKDVGCVDGVTVEGLTDMKRNPRIGLHIMREEITKHNTTGEQHKPTIKIFGYGQQGTRYTPVVLPDPRSLYMQDEAYQYEVQRYVDTLIDYCDKRWRMDYGPVLYEDIHELGCMPVKLKQGRPILVNHMTGTVKLDLSLPASEDLYFIGQAAMTHGYPVSGAMGDLAGCYEIVYGDGEVQTIPLRNGIEIANVHCFLSATHIDPKGAALYPAMEVTWDETHEKYKIQILHIKASKQAPISALYIKTEAPYAILLYGLTVS